MLIRVTPTVAMMVFAGEEREEIMYTISFGSRVKMKAARISNPKTNKLTLNSFVVFIFLLGRGLFLNIYAFIV